MYNFYADDGRVLTPPKELEPQLKGSFPAFSKLIGHVRFFYMTDEIWDGKTLLILPPTANSWQLSCLAKVFFIFISLMRTSESLTKPCWTMFLRH